MHSLIEVQLMTEERFLQKVAELARVPRELLDDSTPIDPLNWDSIELIDLIAAIDEEFGITVPINQINACSSVGELRQRVQDARK
jgi:acyl carrier protein